MTTIELLDVILSTAASYICATNTLPEVVVLPARYEPMLTKFYYRQIFNELTVKDLILQISWVKGIVIDPNASHIRVERPKTPEAIPLILYCPMCQARHVDEGEFFSKPHHTHACQYCGHVWRPAIVNTVGMRFLPGFKNEEKDKPEESAEILVCAREKNANTYDYKNPVGRVKIPKGELVRIRIDQPKQVIEFWSYQLGVEPQVLTSVDLRCWLEEKDFQILIRG